MQPHAVFLQLRMQRSTTRSDCGSRTKEWLWLIPSQASSFPKASAMYLRTPIAPHREATRNLLGEGPEGEARARANRFQRRPEIPDLRDVPPDDVAVRVASALRREQPATRMSRRGPVAPDAMPQGAENGPASSDGLRRGADRRPAPGRSPRTGPRQTPPSSALASPGSAAARPTARRRWPARPRNSRRPSSRDTAGW